MAIISAEKLFVAGIKKEEIDFLILVTQSSDYVLPTSACIIQDRLGLKKSCLSFDINMGCSGYIYGLMVAASMIEVGVVKKGFLICSETYSKYIDKNNRTCRPLFGDGAAATLLIACTDDKFGPFDLGTDGSGYSNLIVPASGARKADKDIEPRLFMDGASVFMFTMDMVPKSVNSLCEKARIAISDIDLFIFHQASRVVLENIVRRLGLDQQKVFVNNCEIGNTVSASIPIALKDAQSQNRLKRGNKVMLVGFGVGYSWGSCLINW
jgi:3-oxoacyl-[acyl-carrier-protein] synthase-3